MVTKPSAPSPDTLRQDADGHWQCNVVASCDGVATLQAPLPCPTGCDAAIAQHEKIIAAKRNEAESHERALEIVRDEMQRAAESGEAVPLSATELAAVRLGHDTLKQLRADIEKLEAARAGVAEEHTHPAMACSKHEKQLQQLVDATA